MHELCEEIGNHLFHDQVALGTREHTFLWPAAAAAEIALNATKTFLFRRYLTKAPGDVKKDCILRGV